MPVYAHLHVITGTDDFRRTRAIRAVLEHYAPGEARHTNVDRVTGSDLTAVHIDDVLDSFALFSFGDGTSDRLLIVDEAEDIRSDVEKHLVTAVDSAAVREATAALLLIYSPEKEKAPKAIADRTGRQHPCGPLDKRSAVTHVLTQARARGIDLPPSAAQLLLDHVGYADAGQLAQEVEKIALLCDGRPVTEEIVAEASGARIGRTVFNLCDSFGHRDFAAAQAILQELLNDRGEDPVGISILFSKHVAALLRARARQHRGIRGPAAADFYWPEWKQTDLASQAAEWSFPALESAMDRALLLELAMKSGGKDNAANLFANYLLECAA